MSDEPAKVHILDREFLVACEPQARDSLLNAAAYLDRHMREIRDSGRIVGNDRIAVMAALNIAHEMLEQQRAVSDDEQAARRIERLHQRISGFLDREGGPALGTR